ncbi:MAG: hypothetical protein IPI67_07540 [Myxococcales bacterium]|nr:hypothetical protein [Myxococcales bacterium]
MPTVLSYRALFLVPAALLALAACGGSTSSDGSGTGGAAGAGGSGATGGGGSGGGCDYQGKKYPFGASFPAGDGCNTCGCLDDGSVGCTLVDCVSGCDYDGVHYNPGDSFPANDGCNKCTCEGGGAVSCTEIGCAAPCVYGGKAYPVGDKFPALDGCNTCVCESPKVVSCTTKACQCDPAKEWWKKYVATDPKTCMVIDFACPPSTKGFENQCGCGCEQDPSCPQFIDCMPPSDCTDLVKKCPYSGVAY